MSGAGERRGEVANAFAEKKKTLADGTELPIECLNLHFKQTRNVLHHIPHYHDYIEFLFALEPCETTVWVAGERVCMRTGDMVVINSNVTHDFFHMLPFNRYICIKVVPEVIYFSENSAYDIRYVIPFLQDRLTLYRQFRREDLENTEIPQAFADMVKESEGRKFGYEIALKSLILKIFLWMIRYDTPEDGVGEREQEAVPQENFRLIRQSVEYINRNFADVTEGEAAAVANMSYSHYSRMFRTVMGKNFHDYLNSLRIREAERLLLSTDLPVVEIALACGFATSSYFIERFRRAKGYTPGQYRLNWRKMQNFPEST